MLDMEHVDMSHESPFTPKDRTTTLRCLDVIQEDTGETGDNTHNIEEL